MKPMIIIPPKTMSDADIAELRKNDICVVVATDPARVKFVDPIPAASSRTQIEDAAIKLSRLLLNGQTGSVNLNSYSANISKLFVECLINGTSLDSRGTKQEQEALWYDRERIAEVQRIAREDARAERKARKEALAKASEKPKT